MNILLNTYQTAFARNGGSGGAERHLMSLYSELNNKGLRALLFNIWNPRIDEVDLVHYFSIEEGSLNFCRFVKSQKIPLVVSPNKWLTKSEDVENPDEIYQIFNLADKVILNSLVELNNFQKIFNEIKNKFEVVPVGVSAEALNPEDSLTIKEFLNLKSRFVLCANSIYPHKNQLQLIKAMKSFPELKLLLIGEIRDVEYANKCFDLGGDQVIYSGALPHKSKLLRSAFNAAEVFVLPSNFESPSLSSLEAAAQNTKLILPVQGSSKEYFGDQAQYVESNNLDQLVSAIENVLSTPKSKNLSNLINDKYNISHTASQYIKIYNQLKVSQHVH